ncbi:hypothetical protein B0H19DRAFT_1245845 [Mycena capillaripes]|nr:hypothetical protein B0H19DRAFT_1245845 [Mycena capillaripes]
MSRSRTPPVTVSPMRPMHIHKFGALDRWLASAEMKTSPELFMRSPLPDGDAMCEIYISHHLGFNGQNYLLSLAVYHPRVAIDHAIPDIELARYVGYADDPGAPLWVRRLPPRKLLRFPQPLHFIGKVLGGMTDIPLGPLLWNGSDKQLRQLCFDNWVRNALAIAPSPPTPKPIRCRCAAVKWIDIKYDSKTFARFTYRKACNLQLLRALEICAEILVIFGWTYCLCTTDLILINDNDFNGEQDSEDRAAPILPISTSGLDALHPSSLTCVQAPCVCVKHSRKLRARVSLSISLGALDGSTPFEYGVLLSLPQRPILDGEPAPTPMQLHLNSPRVCEALRVPPAVPSTRRCLATWSVSPKRLWIRFGDGERLPRTPPRSLPPVRSPPEVADVVASGGFVGIAPTRVSVRIRFSEAGRQGEGVRHLPQASPRSLPPVRSPPEVVDVVAGGGFVGIAGLRAYSASPRSLPPVRSPPEVADVAAGSGFLGIAPTRVFPRIRFWETGRQGEGVLHLPRTRSGPSTTCLH